MNVGDRYLLGSSLRVRNLPSPIQYIFISLLYNFSDVLVREMILVGIAVEVCISFVTTNVIYGLLICYF